MSIISSPQSSGSVTAIASVTSVTSLKKAASETDAAPVATAAIAPVQEKKMLPPTAAQLQQAVDEANKVLETKTSKELQFSVDKSTDIPVVKMINKQTGETLLQFPSEAMLQIAKSIDRVTGAIIRKQA